VGLVKLDFEKFYSEALPVVCDLSRSAGDAIMEIYDSEDFAVEEKSDKSPLTAADLASHQILAEGLAQISPSLPVLSEESKQVPFETRSSWSTYWLVDPLDGTKEFVKRNGEFTVNVALVKDHFPVLGVVYAPAIDRLYFASAGSAAYVQDSGKPARPIAASAGDPPRVVGSRSHAGGHLQTFLDRIGEHSLVSMGSSLKLCLVAEGAADVYPRLGPTSEWDTAAAQCVAEEAGASVTDLHGVRLSCNRKDSFLNPFFIVSAEAGKDWRPYLPTDCLAQ